MNTQPRHDTTTPTVPWRHTPASRRQRSAYDSISPELRKLLDWRGHLAGWGS